MKIHLWEIVLFLLAISVANSVARESESELVWFDRPATHFTESSPLGNGRLGAMIYGGTIDETVVLNESGMWSGSTQEADRLGAAEFLPEIRRLLFLGKNVAAEKLMNEEFTCTGQGSGHGSAAELPYGSYQTLCKLQIKFLQNETAPSVQNYRRELDLHDAVVRIEYSRNGVDYLREAFVSFPDQVFLYRFTANKKNSLSFDVSLSRSERSNTKNVGKDELQIEGQLDDGKEGETGVGFCSRVRVLHDGGMVTTQDGTLKVRSANSVVLLVSAATDLEALVSQVDEDIYKATEVVLDRAAAKPFADLLKDHISDYQNYYNRVGLRLAPTRIDSRSKLPTEERLHANWRDTQDNSLAALYFNFGRYLLISSSRPGGRPANLQGIWASEIQTPWNGDWHANINVQMNYWPAEVCNLAELHEPLFRLIESLVEPGSQTAQIYYNARGWVSHVLANPWGFTSPAERVSWGSTNTCSAWLCQHLWEHYLFTQDREFLLSVYPIMKEAAQFYLDTLVEHPTQEWFVTAPSTSPENRFLLPNGEEASICIGATMDMQILRSFLYACREAANELDCDEVFRTQLSDVIGRLAPTRIASDGRIMEWDQEYPEKDPEHRHVSHLWGLYPGDEISNSQTPELAAAARKSLNVRGDSGTGWGLANKIAMWARLHDGDRAHRLLQQHLHPVTHGQRKQQWSGGTYPNLFDAHPPFQIDGNFGATAAIAEMLVQSSISDIDNIKHVNIELLPALPTAWPEGEVRGLCTRGGFEIALNWKDGKLGDVEIHSRHGLPLQLRYKSQEVTLTPARGEKVHFDGDLKLLSTPKSAVVPPSGSNK
ncbi:glycoside hydrolase family 95 protein [Bythopirellula goksoeyrii]|uniref:Uncharacterized protein n=1 Tax=Bythopirellula goksoeyrii TaxID=1400387 RepID=A0A5B9Q9U5_9BACT|nr:glycoside hydrolase family 95 protein [Bythopirellula goksoeyrii]QEG35747.1 hypothetical protein Pr1d_30530 [Bythopirellula goksoeyrii]